MEIIDNSPYVLRNMGIYSQVTKMVWIKGIWLTTQYENIVSSLNKDKLPITIMQITLKQYLGLNLPQTMRGMMWISEMEMVMMTMLIEMHPSMLRRSGDDDGFDFPFFGSLGAA
jgi:hypothetical protein